MDSIHLDNRLTLVDELVFILDRDVRRLRSREISLGKVQWKHCLVDEETIEIKSEM